MPDLSTPMMRQYRQIRRSLPDDTILFFRLGDFYEMFFEDAKRAAAVLDITLTKRNKVPMCGVPYHSADMYLAKLIRAGQKVAICDQMEDPAAAKGIVRREVTRVVTPGTILEENILDNDRNNYLAGLYQKNGKFGFALLDLSTGSFSAEEFDSGETLAEEFKRFVPSECVIPSEQLEAGLYRGVLDPAAHPTLTGYEDWTFEYDVAYDTLTRHFCVHSLDGFGCEGAAAIIGAAGGVLHYVAHALKRQVGHVRRLQVRRSADFLLMDEATCANLDLAVSRSPTGVRGGTAHTLLAVLNTTRTAMGARLLRSWILRPLADLARITARHDVVESLCRDRAFLRELREALAQVKDLERLIARLGTGSGNARDIRALAQSLAALPRVRELVAGQAAPLLRELGANIHPLPDLVALVERAIEEEPPIPIRDGGLIKAGYNADLDELRNAATEGRRWLAEFQAAEQARTGIKTLKVRHNKVFGYYIEVSKGQLGNVPESYVRKQTLVNAERFITPDLKEWENKILGAQDRATALEYELFIEIRAKAVAETDRIQAGADALAQLDVLAGLADKALSAGYVRPAMNESDRLLVKGGRHPVIESMPDAERFVPNDAQLDCSDNQLIIITGPNMAGKSTYIRQVALIAVMAQMGSFVPAASAEIGVVDRVFTRVGASDDLTRGRSTFMVEMQETANILNNASARSLIVLDEIGRGTSTFDGISIAWAVAEYLHNHARVKAKTLFATHYHELTDLALTMPGIKNYNVRVRERNDRVVFLRKIVPGAADKSYGIQVARLAGLPAEVIDRAKEILSNLEEGEFGEMGQPKIARHRPRKGRYDPSQLSLFDAAGGEKDTD
ncbi:MAG: DNA mismatch repair protein MutS [Kiritimatiellae bacterium]|nr:DNA mismatch repair protein MutS [Kiritimatiellia bacterium]